MEQNGKDSELMTRGEVAKMLRVCSQTVSRIVGRGELAAVRINARLVRYRRSDVDEFLIRHQRRGVEAPMNSSESTSTEQPPA